ncbi:hypothetical protein Hanom_Chr09g00814871 [Helianthus anomalus]
MSTMFCMIVNKVLAFVILVFVFFTSIVNWSWFRIMKYHVVASLCDISVILLVNCVILFSCVCLIILCLVSWMYVMVALYFFSCVRDVFLAVHFVRVCVGYHCCLMVFFDLLLVFVLLQGISCLVL